VTHRPTLDMEQLDSGRISHSTLRLPPLGTAAAQALVDGLLGPTRGPSAGLRRRILERGGGNPLFIEEIVRTLVEEGVIVRDGPSWRVAADEAAATIPASIETMLLARIDRLPHAVRRLAQRAAVIGPRFSAGLLAAVSPDPADVDFGLDLLCDAEVIEESEATEAVEARSYRFTQAMLQDVIYQNLLRQRRSELHERIGVALEHICGEDPVRLGDLTQLGHHFIHGISKAKGAAYLAAAGDRARAVHAHEDALRLFQTALQVLPDEDAHRSQRLALLEQIGDLSGPLGRRDAAHDHYRQVLEVFTAESDQVAAARVVRKIAGL
ncbi:adenylate/guanylate cyclase domain-containing protein, partial [Rhizobiaceae sp. 2RAB30]